ncbi:pseudaminic acid cytidylyltransferase [Photobacterium kasasachensis]|uniref:pseudaminic acid cytidylyltransferase n=1 Tax=Photobacterium kasasachensis TaxID=2910240 RepID=UPI003D15089B
MKVAIIPARGGSKRIPRKNIKPFLGKPIIAYSIEAAKQAGCFDRIIVSTDDEEIAKVAASYGAEIPFLRSAVLSDDFTGTNAVVADTLRRLEQKVDYACCIYATAPFVRPETLSRGFELLTQNANSEFSVTVTSFPFPIQRAVHLNQGKLLDMREPENRMTRSQDLEEMYHDAGQVYWGRALSFLNDKPLFAGNTEAIMLPRYLVQDIDTLEDWTRAENMYRVLEDQGLV